MSFRVLVIPEDPTYNGAILQPLVERILAKCGRPRADVRVLTGPPRVGGFEDAVKKIPEIAERNRTFDLLLFLPDSDGKERGGTFRRLERRVPRLVCCAAVQEVEVWLLAGHAGKLEAEWQDVRADLSVKENVFQPFLKQHGEPRQPDGGRERLMRETLKNYRRLLRLCPELADLEQRVRAILS